MIKMFVEYAWNHYKFNLRKTFKKMRIMDKVLKEKRLMAKIFKKMMFSKILARHLY